MQSELLSYVVVVGAFLFTILRLFFNKPKQPVILARRPKAKR
jgi:hypothetical protein